MDFGAPVAAGVQGPSAGIQTLSGLLGLKQQQLSLQQQKLAITKQSIGISQAQQELSQQTSQAEQAAIHTQNLQGLQSVDWKAFTKPDGSYDMDAASAKALQVGGADAAPFVSRLAEMVQQGTAAKSALFKLNQQYQEPVRSAFALYGSSKDETPSDLAVQLETIRDNAPAAIRPNLDAIIKSSLGHLAAPDLLTGTPKSPAQQKAAALAFARTGLTPQETAGPSGLATPAVGTENTGAAIVPVAQSRTTGVVTPQAGALGAQLPPTVVQQPITGAPAIVGGAQGSTPQPIGGSGASTGPAPWWKGTWQPQPGQSQMVTGQVEALQHRINSGEVAANTTPQAIDALDRARAILDTGISTGTTFDALKSTLNTLAGAGLDTNKAHDVSDLAKNLARYEAARANSIGSTDASRALIHAGSPNTSLDNAAVKGIVLQSLGIEKMIQAYAKVVGGAPDPHSALVAEQKFRSTPHLVQAYELGLMRNKQEADDFLKRYNISGKELAASVAELKKLGAW